MEYQICVLFDSPTRSPSFTFSDVITEDDWTCLNYWDDIGDFVSRMISDAESFIKKAFPDGHDYNLSTVNITYVGDDEE